MSLIHWWPLNENLQDKIQGKIFNNSGMTSDASGKIGSCYGTSDGHTLSITVEIPSTFSFSCWVKNNDFTYPKTNIPVRFSQGSPYSTPNTINKGWEFSHGTAGTSYKFTMNDSATKNEISWTNAQYIGNALLGQWYHVALTVEHSKKEVTLYINGTNLGTRTYTPNDFGGTFSLVIGQLSGWKLDGYLNDIRIYNHALSKKEVKELSKGLVLHYTFDSAALESTTNYSVPSQWSIHSPYWTLITNTPTGFKIKKTAGNTETTVAFSNATIYNTMAIGETWTASYYLYKNGQPYKTTTTAPTNYGIGLTVLKSEARDDGYFSSTFTITSKSSPYPLHVRIFGDTISVDDEYEIRYVQFERKDHATLYTPNTRSAILYNNVGLSVENNISTANTIYSPDAAIGSGALKCSNTSLRTPITGDITQGVTISCWVKGSVPTDSRVVFADYNSKLAFGFFNNGQAIITCAGYGHKCVTDIKTPWTSNWNHIVVRRDSTGVVKCFLNSNDLDLKGSQEWTHSENTFSIGSRYSGGWTSYFNGLVDDVRVYHTTLSDNDIKELYESRWAANRQGQVFSNAINERQEKFQITRSGITNCNILNESGNLPNGYTPLAYIESSGTQFINTNHLATQNTRTIFDYEYLNSSASWAGLFGSDNNPTNNNMGYGLFLNGSTYSCYVSNHTTGGCWNQQVGTWTQNQRTLLDFTHSKLIVDNIAYNLKTTTFTTSLVPIYLFAFRRSAGNAGVSSIRLYNCQIWEGAALVRNFIPVIYHDPQYDEVGLYDTVTGQFYGNAGSDMFTAGPKAVSQSRDGSLYCAEFNEI